MGREAEEPTSTAPGDEDQTAPILKEATAAPAASHPARDRPCPVCGGSGFRWGWLESGLYGTGKGPAAAKQPKYVKQKTRFGEFIGLRARLCDDCGHVEIFAWREGEE